MAKSVKATRVAKVALAPAPAVVEVALPAEQVAIANVLTTQVVELPVSVPTAARGAEIKHVEAWRSLSGKKARHTLPAHLRITALPEVNPWQSKAADAPIYLALAAKRPATWGEALEMVAKECNISAGRAHSGMVWLFTWGKGLTLEGQAYNPKTIAELVATPKA